MVHEDSCWHRTLNTVGIAKDDLNAFHRNDLDLSAAEGTRADAKSSPCGETEETQSVRENGRALLTPTSEPPMMPSKDLRIHGARRLNQIHLQVNVTN